MTPIPDQWFHRIKAATRDLVKMCGGIDRAVKITQLSATSLSRFQSANHADIISIAGALALEMECGQRLITSAMAEMHGCQLSEAGDDAAIALAAFAGVAEAVRGASDLMAASADAAPDGKLTPAEAERLDRAASSIETSIAPLRQTLAAAKGSIRRVK